MQRERTSITAPRGRRELELARTRTTDLVFRSAFVSLAILSTLGLGGCRAVEAIFKVGAWLGALIVIAIVAVVGGVVALVTRK